MHSPLRKSFLTFLNHLIFGHDSLVDLVELLRIDILDNGHVERGDLEAPLVYRLQRRPELALADGVRLHYAQRAV